MYFSRTFKALNFDFQIQGLLRTFKVRANPESIWPSLKAELLGRVVQRQIKLAQDKQEF